MPAVASAGIMQRPSIQQLREERLLEACCLGDFDEVKRLVRSGVDVNCKNMVNLWSPLHWAVHRNHYNIVEFLLDHGADISLTSSTGVQPAHLSKHDDIHALLNIPLEQQHQQQLQQQKKASEDFIPNYLRHPPFPYCDSNSCPMKDEPSQPSMSSSSKHEHSDVGLLLLKARIAGGADCDFVEVELSQEKLTYASLLRELASELDITEHDIIKIRKLPDVIIRKDRDVGRLTNGQSIEVVIKRSE